MTEDAMLDCFDEIANKRKRQFISSAHTSICTLRQSMQGLATQRGDDEAAVARRREKLRLYKRVNCPALVVVSAQTVLRIRPARIRVEDAITRNGIVKYDDLIPSECAHFLPWVSDAWVIQIEGGGHRLRARLPSGLIGCGWCDCLLAFTLAAFAPESEEQPRNPADKRYRNQEFHHSSITFAFTRELGYTASIPVEQLAGSSFGHETTNSGKAAV